MYIHLEITRANCSPHGMKDSVRVIFANEQLIKQYGVPRPQEECAHLMRLTSEEAQRKRRNWLSKAAMVGLFCSSSAGVRPVNSRPCCEQGKHGHQAWMDVRQLMMPVFSGVTLDGPSRMLRVDSKVCLEPTISKPRPACCVMFNPCCASSQMIALFPAVQCRQHLQAACARDIGLKLLLNVD